MPVDRCNHWHRQIHQRPVHAFKQFVLQCPLLFSHAVTLFQIATGTEYFFACTSQHNATDITRVSCETVPEVKHVVTHLSIHGVAHLRPIDGDF